MGNRRRLLGNSPGDGTFHRRGGHNFWPPHDALHPTGCTGYYTENARSAFRERAFEAGHGLDRTGVGDSARPPSGELTISQTKVGLFSVALLLRK